MKCISIRQPWAFLVCAGVRSIENRTWSTKHRGLVAVHAGGYRKAVDLLPSELNSDVFTFGAIIGVCEIDDVVPYENVRQKKWAEGPYCFLLRNAKLFVNPIAHKGRVNLVSLDDDVSDLVEERMGECVNVKSITILNEIVRAVGDGPIDKSLLRQSDRYR